MQMELHHLLLELYKSLFVTNCSHFPNRVKSSDALEIPESCADVRWNADRGDEQGTASVPRQPERVYTSFSPCPSADVAKVKSRTLVRANVRLPRGGLWHQPCAAFGARGF